MMRSSVQQGGAQEVATIRVAAFGLLDRPSPNEARPTAPVSHQAREWRNIWIDPVHGWTKVPVFAGFDGSGASVEGPALIEEDTTTILLGVGDRLRTTPGGNYLIELS